MSVLDDEQIAVGVQKGDADLFGVLIERYESKMARYANKFLFGYDEAQDVVQDVFVKAFTNIQSFDARRKFSPWLYRIAHNEFINAIKKKGREHITYFDPDTLFPFSLHQDIQVKDTDGDIKKTMDACLDKLDPKYREPLVLYYYEELDYKEIADILQIPLSTVGIRLKRGKASLKKIFDQLHPQYEH